MPKNVKLSLTPLQLKNSLKTQNLITLAKKFSISKQYMSQLYAQYRAQYPDLFRNDEISKEQLANLLDEHTIAEICNITGKSYHEIRKLMRSYGITRETVTASFDPDYIRQQYVELCRSDKELADYYGCSVSLIRKFRYEHSILKSDRKPLGERLSKPTAEKLVYTDGLSASQLAAKFDATQNEIIKLLEKYGIDPTAYSASNTD